MSERHVDAASASGSWVRHHIGPPVLARGLLRVRPRSAFNGLARLGTNPGDLLRRSVPGYSTANDPARRPIGDKAANFFPEF
jgi:hypothetical protein